MKLKRRFYKTSLKYKVIFSVIVVFLFSISIGFAFINNTFNFFGTIGLNIPNYLYISKSVIVDASTANKDKTIIKDFYSTNLESEVVLSNTDSNSSATFEITISNPTSNVYRFNKVIYDDSSYSNPNITFSLKNLDKSDRIEAHQSITFKITFYYLNHEISVDNKLISLINFDFTLVSSAFEENSIYSWNTSVFKTTILPKTMQLLDDLNVKDIYMKLDLENDIENTKKIISNLKSSGRNVYFLDGDYGWYDNPERIKTLIDSVANYNNSVVDNEKFSGVVIDVEPYRDPVYKEDKYTGFQTYVNTVEEYYQHAKSLGIKIINVIPYWYDSYTTEEGFTEEQRLGSLELLKKLFQNSDKVSIMNYSKTRMVKNVSTEIELAENYGIEIESIAEFGSSDEEGISLWDEDEPIEYSNNEWSKIKDTYSYEKVNFSYHYIYPILKKLGMIEETTLEFVTEDEEVLSKGKVKIAYSTGEKIEASINDTILLTSEEYTIESDDFLIIKMLKEEDLGELKKKKTYLVEKTYSLEGYFSLNDSSIKEGVVKLINLETNEEHVGIFNEQYSYFKFSHIKFDTPYKVVYIDINGDNDAYLVSAEASDEYSIKHDIYDQDKNIFIKRSDNIRIDTMKIYPSIKLANSRYRIDAYLKIDGHSAKTGSVKLIDTETGREIVGEFHSSDSYFRFKEVINDRKYRLLYTSEEGNQYTVASASAKDETDIVHDDLTTESGIIVFPDLRPSTHRLYPTIVLVPIITESSNIPIYIKDSNDEDISGGKLSFKNNLTGDVIEASYIDGNHFESSQLEEDTEYSITYIDDFGNTFEISTATAKNSMNKEITISNDMGNISIPLDSLLIEYDLVLKTSVSTYKFPEIYVNMLDGTRANSGYIKLIDTITGQEIIVSEIREYTSSSGSIDYYFRSTERIFSEREYRFIYVDELGNEYTDINEFLIDLDDKTRISALRDNGTFYIPNNVKTISHRLYPAVILNH